MSQSTRQKLRNVILCYGESYQEFGEKIPVQYRELHEQIGKMRKTGIRVITYRHLEKVNFALETPLSPEELKLFVQFQHNCGFILYFNDTRLMHIVVLDPKLIIDATKCIVTSERFAVDTWDKSKWDNMVTTGKMDKSYIIGVWEKSSTELLYRHREYLLGLLERLDIISKPKAYDNGLDVPMSFFYVPCMLRTKARQNEATIEHGDLTLSFKFKDLLPPAVVHKVFASCLGLWPVEANCLFNGWAALGSGPNHIIILQKESCNITVTIRHRHDATKIDVNLVRSIKHFLIQTIQRIVSFYDDTLEKNTGKIYTIEYNKSAVSRGIGLEQDKVRTRCNRGKEGKSYNCRIKRKPIKESKHSKS